MEKHAVCLSLLLVVLLVGLSESCPRMRCCTDYNEDEVSIRFLKSYTIQDIKHVCNIKAVIFTTLKNRHLCANPDADWVKEAMKIVPEKPICRHGRNLQKSS